MGAIPKTSRQLVAFGNEIGQDFRAIYGRLGIVFQDDSVIDELTCREHFQIFCELIGYTPDEIEDEIESLTTMLTFTKCLDSVAKQLSGGEKRKRCMGLALASRPSILILDEPTAGVDAHSRQTIWKAVARFEGSTALISCHSLEEAQSVATRFLVMLEGSVAFLGTAAELRSQYQCGYDMTFLDNAPNMQTIHACAHAVVPEVVIREDRRSTLFVPADLGAADVLAELEQNKDELGFTRYTVRLENLEATLARLIEDVEATRA
jgi:ABC-type multidrug transport system ATPase subunit